MPPFSFHHHSTVHVTNDVTRDGLRDSIDGYLGAVSWIALTAVAGSVRLVDAAEISQSAGRAALIAVLDDIADEASMRRVLGYGARGLVLADDPLPDYLRAVHDVACHGGWISPRLAARIVAMARPAPPCSDVDRGLAALTVRELEVLSLLAQGMENAQIATTMYVSVSAVKYHISNLLRKLSCRDRTQLVALVYRTGLGARAQGVGVQ